MLGHATGMIGFPLRLLARENYDRIVRLKGARAVALITGEEKIVPPNPAYFVCTVESMPLDRQVDFLAIDEIQLAADPERGHVFTARLLRARGRQETMFLGSDTIRPLLRRLVPEAEYVARPRFSTLTYTGPQKVTRLPPRSAVVAFAVADVFHLAELVRRQRGGTAVVLGALSPRARNAQVAMYQAGEVDYMVATDAIGMGLNMDLDHVAFARLAKFDGRAPRRLTPAEIAQIAGRAGRHMNDGTFGTTADLGPIDEDVVEAVETHRFDPLTHLFWRNTDLDFRSAGALLRSLETRPPRPFLVKASEADDQHALATLIRQPEITAAAGNPAAVRLLWEVCQIPDFRKVMSDTHARLLAEVFRHLTGPIERLADDWVAAQLGRLDRIDGDIDTLVTRIAHVRTWTYITHRPHWLGDGPHWQERARTIEDRLSDTLHDRLTQRFVDRRSAFLVKHLKECGELAGSIARTGEAAGEVRVEGHFVGAMRGFRFVPDPAASGAGVRTLMVAANRLLPGEIAARARQFAAEPDAALSLLPDGQIAWMGMLGAGEPIGRLLPGDTPLTPRAEPLAFDFLEGELRDMVRRRLGGFVRGTVESGLRPLFIAAAAGTGAGAASELGPAARGLVFRLGEALGSLPAEPLGAVLAALSPADRKRLTRLGLRFGTETVYVESLLKPKPRALAALLWSVHAAVPLPGDVPAASRLSVEAGVDWPVGLGNAIGFRRVGPRAIRVDRLERLAAALRRLARPGPFALNGALASLIGCPLVDLQGVVAALGYRAVVESGVITYRAIARGAGHRSRRVVPRPAPIIAEDHPFAKLKALRLAP
ncbi:MAG TPA: helicase-related protein [Stellaceae bacterium]|nr:helicase-related protein [Stellaceae bacterium]